MTTHKYKAPRLVMLGRAYVRLIESAQIIARFSDVDEDRAALQTLIETYQAELRELLGIVSPATAADILMASEKLMGPVKDGRLN